MWTKNPRATCSSPKLFRTALSVMSLDLAIVSEDLGVYTHGDEVAEVAADVRVPCAVLGHLEGARVAAGKVLAHVDVVRLGRDLVARAVDCCSIEIYPVSNVNKLS